MKYISTRNTSFHLTEIVDEENKSMEKEQAFYQSGVGTLMYLTKHPTADITNAVRELSKSMDGASKLQLCKLSRVAKFVLGTKHLGLCIVPTMNDEIW